MMNQAAVSLRRERKRGIQLTVAALLTVMLVVVVLVYDKFTAPRVLSEAEMVARGVYVFEVPRKLPPLGLLNQDAEAVAADSLRGKWSLLFFGFTQCPDVCPTTLSELKKLYSLLDPAAQKHWTIRLFSLDPERDTPARLKAYVGYFHPDFEGLTTAEAADTAAAARAFNVAFRKQPLADSYTIDHSAHLAIVNPRGHYHGLIKPPLDAGKLAEVLKSLQRAW